MKICVSSKRRDQRVSPPAPPRSPATYRGATAINTRLPRAAASTASTPAALRHTECMVLFNAVDAHRLEGARSHMQGDKRHLNAFGAQFVQQWFVECKPAVGAATAPGLVP